MKNTSLAAFAAAIFLACLPTTANATALSDLTAATGSNTINNGNNNQTWQWNSLTVGPGLKLQSNGTAATSGQEVLHVELDGANSGSTINTTAAEFDNYHTGTNNSDIGVLGIAEGGAHNTGVLGETDGTNSGDNGVTAVSLGTSGVNYALTAQAYSSAGYAGYFTNFNNGYAAAFMGGNVGIGMDTPTHTLDVSGTLNVSGAVTCGSGCGAGPWSVSGSSIIPSSTSYSLGIGTTSPKSLVHAYGGEVQVGSSGASCAALNGGAIRFSSSTLYYCDGSSTWQSVTSSAGGLPALTAADIWVGNASNVATAVALSGDCTLSNSGVITCTKTNGTSFGTLATQFGVNLSSQATGTLQAGQFPALTGDVTTTAGSLATTVAKIQGTTVSGTTGSGNVVFSASPTLTGTITGAAANFGGNVGIGTTSPASQLYIVSPSASNTIPVAILEPSMPNGGLIQIQLGQSAAPNTDGTIIYTYNSTTPALSYLSLGLYNDSFTLNVLGNGNVGIGTTAPLDQLHVTSGSAADSSGEIGLGYDDSTSNVKLQIFANSGHAVYSGIQSFSSAPFILNPVGNNVGIQTTSPSYTLQVNGSVAGTSAYVNTSDIRHKKNIEPLKDGLNIVEELKPVTFEWKDDAIRSLQPGPVLGKTSFSIRQPRLEDDPAMKGKQMGFIAQDVEKILPSVVVVENNAEKTKGMKYSEFIPVLVKAIQELKADNDNLRAQLSGDEATIAAMKTKLGM